MSEIHLLDQNLINKIAAGEVVERPASVVKELIENSIDAESTSIKLELENGGIDLIRIIDNEKGISPEDAKMSIQRHATSKIRTVDDLMSLSTLGFRGEALAAISSVSHFRLNTKQSDDIAATEVLVKDGKTTVKKSSGADGTIIEIQGLFYSVPARKKFLKSANTEFKHVLDVFTRQALLHPHIAFSIIHNGKVISDYPISSDWKERVQQLLGKDLGEDLIDLHHQRASLRIKGFLVHPAKAQKNRNLQYLFVNNRAVSDYLISKAV